MKNTRISLPLLCALPLLAGCTETELAGGALLLVGIGGVVAAAAQRNAERQRGIRAGGSRPGFNAISPNTELLDGFETPDDRAMLGPTPDAHDLAPLPPPRIGLTALPDRDPAFSLPDLLEYISRVYVRAAEARGTGQLDAVRGFLSEGAVETLMGGRIGLHGVDNVLVTLPELLEFTVDEDWAGLSVRLRALMDERRDGVLSQAIYTERWRLVRRVGSEGRGRLPALVCPSCGQDAPTDEHWTCTSCQAKRGTPEGQWLIQQILDRERSPLLRAAASPGHHVEQGTSLGSVQSPKVAEAREEFQTRESAEALAALDAWPALAFDEVVGAALTAPDDRHFTPAALRAFSFQREIRYATGLIQQIQEPRLSGAEMVRLDRDARYDIATFRVFSEQRAWVMTDVGELWQGSDTDTRVYSEYWTVLRPREDDGQTGWRLWQIQSDEDYIG